MKVYLPFLCLMCILICVPSQAENAVTAGEFIVEPATFHNLGFEWKIEGDDNRNATVSVSFREENTADWKPAQPLLRIGDEKVWRAKEFLEYWTPRMFAGSIFGLEPGHRYACRFEMTDPDGVVGTAIKEVLVFSVGTRVSLH